MVVVSTLFALSAPAEAQPGAQRSAPDRAAALVQDLRQFPAALPAMPRSDGRADPTEERRRRVYDELLALGSAAIPALADGLADPDVQVRRNVAFFLNIAAGTWNKSLEPKLDIRGCLRSLIAALKDRDAPVRALAAQAVGSIGPDASSAVPSLIALLAYPDEGSRHSACIGLSGIGPRAREALPELHKALADPSASVRRVAQEAISAIESP
jgi:HEAT repeat protein